jgi:hypothetical protein
MANLIRSAKSGSDWTTNELDAYHITFVNQTTEEFFGVADLPALNNPSIVGFLNTENRIDAQDAQTKKLLHYLDLALTPKEGQESAVDTFARVLLEKLGYDEGERIILTRHALPLVICGTRSQAQTDLCVMDDRDILLLLQEDKSLSSTSDPEPQVIAAAIAAFGVNNKTRQTSLYLPPLDEVTFPAITMVGTSLTFYKITITTALSAAISHGIYPPEETRVLRYVPVLPRRYSEGMRPLANRVELLSCLQAFKQFLGP